MPVGAHSNDESVHRAGTERDPVRLGESSSSLAGYPRRDTRRHIRAGEGGSIRTVRQGLADAQPDNEWDKQRDDGSNAADNRQTKQ
jgi:hypothetical protein